jgi:Ca-activated chloride channel family protein
VKFAQPYWLAGVGLALVVAGLLIAGGVLLVRAVRRFGEEPRVMQLLTARPSGRRTAKGALLVLAVAFGFLAAAQPQYGRGTRIIPATNLDVVLVLDYSKSMYARDVKPSRIARAKTEVSQLIADLPGARFAAVAFAGEPLAFPLTSDGAAVAQFFRQLSPNDMPVGGTAIARALEMGRELLSRDPIGKNHKKVMILVTDGEDLEGDPVSVAQAAARDGVTVNVVQIGGRTPEPLPEVDDSGEVSGWRTDAEGKPLTTSLTAEGEAQLGKIATATGGRVVRSERGSTGIRVIAAAMRKLMTAELSERVETVYADVYVWPLGLAVLLLLLETFFPETPKRKLPARVPPPPGRTRVRRRRAKGATAVVLGGLLAVFLASPGCEGSVDSLFERNSPVVNEAIEALDGGDAQAAVDLLGEYLVTGKCEGGQIAVGDGVRDKPNAGFDLGLGLFRIAETFGKRFGDEEPTGDKGLSPEEEAALASRGEQVDCALRIVQLVALDPKVPIELRARAHYLSGNLEFLRRNYRAAVQSYDRALKLIPGIEGDAGDGIGRDAAWNRAIALRRIQDEEDKKDASQEAEPDSSDASQDSSPDGGGDSGNPDGGDASNDGGGDDGGSDGGRDSGDDGSSQSDNNDGGKDAGEDSSAEPQNQPDAGAPQEQQPSPNVNQDDRMLDMLERAPTLQQQAARNRALQRQVRSGMEDK